MECDKQGRILIPAHLRKLADLKKMQELLVREARLKYGILSFLIGI